MDLQGPRGGEASSLQSRVASGGRRICKVRADERATNMQGGGRAGRASDLQDAEGIVARG